MPYWLTATPCDACDDNCFACPLRDRPVQLQVVVSEDAPLRAVNGPGKTPEELLGVLARSFSVGEDGFLRLKE